MKARVTIDLPTGVPLQQLLTFVGTAAILHLTVDILADKPVKKSHLLRDRVMAELANGGGLPPLVVEPPPGQKRRYEKSARAIVQEAIEASQEPLTTEELRQLVEAHGHAPNATHTALKELADAGWAVRLDKGLYGRPDTPPPPPAPKKRAAHGREVIAKVFADGAVHSRGGVMTAFGKAGLSPKSADSRLADAVNEGVIVRVGPAVYQLNSRKDDDASPPA